mgnify:FL=1
MTKLPQKLLERERAARERESAREEAALEKAQAAEARRADQDRIRALKQRETDAVAKRAEERRQAINRLVSEVLR